jgi:hypothetical protein
VKLKLGDRVRVTATRTGWWFKVGDVGTVRIVGDYGYTVDMDHVRDGCKSAMVDDDDVELLDKPTPLHTQVGGSHYTDMTIQPIEYILANNIPFPEGNVIKYVSRWRAKGGVKDLEKAKHHLELLIEHEMTKATRAEGFV